MRRTWILALWLCAAAGCSGGASVEFRDALVLYRGPAPGKAAPLFIGFVNADHSAYVEEGNVRADVPGAKPLDRASAARCLDRLADLGYPDRWTPVGDLGSACALRPEAHLLMAEVDGRVHVLVRPAGAGDAESVAELRRFVDSKSVLIEAAGERTGFRVVPNREGSSLFERQIKDLEQSRPGGGR